jgi:hypothetical protein
MYYNHALGMADVFTTISKFVDAVHLARGVALFGLVWGFFKGVESVLADDTKLEIAVWLLDRKKFGPKVQPWPDTFAKVFDRVFGTKHLSWRCFKRSCLASFAAVLVTFVLSRGPQSGGIHVSFKGTPALLFTWAVLIVFINVLPDFLSLLESRCVLAAMRRTQRTALWILLILADFVLTFGIAYIACLMLAWIASLFVYVYEQEPLAPPFRNATFMTQKIIAVGFGNASAVLFYPAFFTSIWLWLYAGSGFILKAARRFDIGFEWFNRKFDIEHHPLQSLGLIAGALVALAYWTAATVKHFFF